MRDEIFSEFLLYGFSEQEKEGARNQLPSGIFLRGTGGGVGEGFFYLHSMFFESNAEKYENQALLTREPPMR